MSLPALWGQDYDLIKNELYGAVPLHMLEGVCRLGMSPSMEKLAIAMLIYRYSPPRRVPPVPLLARAIRISRRHLYGMLKIMQAAGLIVCEKIGRAFSISISGLVERLRSMKKAKDAARPALTLVSRPAPIPRPEPEPEPVTVEEQIEEVHEDELNKLLNAREDARRSRDRERFGSAAWGRFHREFKRLDEEYQRALKRRRKKTGFLATLAVAALGGG